MESLVERPTDMKHEYRIIIMLSVLLFIVPWILPNRYLLNVAVLIGIYSLIAIGLNLLVGYAGQISLGHAAFYGIGAYTAAVLTTRFNWNTLPALGGALLLVGVIAWIIGKPILKLKGHYLAMATLGFGLIMEILLNELDLTGGPQGISNIPKLNVLGLRFSDDFHFYFLIWGSVILVQLMMVNLIKGKMGRAFLAIHTNELAAETLGINTAALKQAAFVISAVLAGLAGAFYAYSLNYISPEPFAFNFSIMLVTMVVIGGMGDLWGPLIGTALLGILPELLRSFKNFDIAVYGLLLILIVIFMPKGVVSLIYRLINKLQKSASKGAK
jgi:branched-chain amino acid transport system permease protein